MIAPDILERKEGSSIRPTSADVQPQSGLGQKHGVETVNDTPCSMAAPDSFQHRCAASRTRSSQALTAFIILRFPKNTCYFIIEILK